MAAVILLSGGVDSSVLLRHVVRRRRESAVYALSFDYGQRHARELVSARQQVATVPEVVEHRVLDMRVFGDLLADASALLPAGVEVPDLEDVGEAERNQPITYVPNRNMVLLSLAAAFAESRECSSVYYGAQAQDRYGYWDCTEEFVLRVNETLVLNRCTPVTVYAPFATWSKAEVVLEGSRLDVPFADTWSCYRGEATACGTCPTCVERHRAFEQAGVKDPLA